MRVRISLIGLVSLVLLSAPGTARADETNAAAVACQGKAAGDPCSVKRPHKTGDGEPSVRDEPGTCQPDQCCTLDYSSGSPPKSSCGPCLTCKAGGPPPPTGTGAPEDGGEPPRTSAGDPPAPTTSKRGCTLAEPGATAPLVVLLAVAWIRRRRGC